MRERFPRLAAMACLLAAAGVSVLWPAAVVITDALRSTAAEHRQPPSGWETIGVGVVARTFLIAGLIAALATIAAWPTAWALYGSAGLRRRLLPWLAAPMLLPSYLAYSGWGVLRGPGTWLGDWLMRGAVGVANPWPAAAGRVLAVVGLALWAWPLATVVLSWRLSAIDPACLEVLRLEPSRGVRAVVLRGRLVLGLARGGVVAAWVAVGLLMIGSAVPLHLAQFETAAVRLWRSLDQTPVDQHWRVWLAAWPVVLPGVLAAAWVGRRLRDADLGGGGGEAAAIGADAARGWRSSFGSAAWRAGVWRGSAVLMIWLAAAALPIALMGSMLRGAGSLGTFWRLNAAAFGESAVISAVVGMAGAAIAAAVWWLSTGPSPVESRLIRGLLMIWLAAALVPGVLVGLAHARAAALLPAELRGGPGVGRAIVAAAHVARFGALPALAGWMLARTEPAALRDAGRLVGGGVRVWARLFLVRRWWAVPAVALATGLLSFHEIESAVMVLPPGVESFARQMLQLLHFNRGGDLAAGVLLVAGVGAVIGCVVSAVVWWGSRAAEKSPGRA